MSTKTNRNQPRPRGKRKKRSEMHELLMLLLISREGPIGRYRLKDLMNLSEREGVVRYMLQEFQTRNLVTASQSGCSLTPKGERVLAIRLYAYDIVDIKAFASPVLTAAPVSIGIHLRNKADQIESVMMIRDLAVRGGALGATILLYQNGKLTIPSVDTNFLTTQQTLATDLHDTFRLKDNDVIAIISADDEGKGLTASLEIAKTLANQAKQHSPG